MDKIRFTCIIEKDNLKFFEKKTIFDVINVDVCYGYVYAMLIPCIPTWTFPKKKNKRCVLFT